MKVEQFKQLIRGIVREELQKSIRPLIKEAVADLIFEAKANSMVVDNTKKARTLREASYGSIDELDEYPTMKATPGAGIDRSRIAQMMGYGEFAQGGGGSAGDLIVDTTFTEHGTPVPFNPADLPDHVTDALTKDYSEMMKTLFKKNG